MRSVADKTPKDFDKLKQLLKQHRAIKNEPLLLAVQYSPKRDKGDIFLFEIADNFGANSVDPGKTIFEVTYGSTPGFPMAEGQELHLLLTSPDEFKIAAKENWKAVRELRKALKEGGVQVLYSTREGESLWKLL